MPKKYRLLRDCINQSWLIPIGSVIEHTGGKEYYSKEYHYYFDGNFVENTPNIFEEIKEKERTEVRDMLFVSSPNSKVWHYNVCMNDEIREEKFPLIKKAIEKVLNDEQPKEETWLSQYTKEHEQKLREDAIKLFATPPFSGEFITKEECERRESMAFDSARKLWADEFQPPKVQLFYETFEAYKTINPF